MNDGEGGTEEDDDIEPEIPVLDIPRIGLDTVIVAGIAAAGYLPKSGEAGLDGVIIFREIAVVLIQFLTDDGARADKTHLPGENIEYLGDFVQTGLSQKFPERGNARVVFQLIVGFPFLLRGGAAEDFLQSFFRIAVHRAEFPRLEVLPVLTYARMPVKDSPARCDFHHERDQQEERQYQDEPYQRQDEVEYPLDCHIEPGFQAVADADHKEAFRIQVMEFRVEYRYPVDFRDQDNPFDITVDMIDDMRELLIVFVTYRDKYGLDIQHIHEFREILDLPQHLVLFPVDIETFPDVFLRVVEKTDHLIPEMVFPLESADSRQCFRAASEDKDVLLPYPHLEENLFTDNTEQRKDYDRVYPYKDKKDSQYRVRPEHRAEVDNQEYQEDREGGGLQERTGFLPERDAVQVKTFELVHYQENDRHPYHPRRVLERQEERRDILKQEMH